MDVHQTYYQVLNVPEDATPKAIRSSYFLLSRVLHPDRFDRTQQPAEWEKANELLRALNEAYSVLRDPARRRTYDERLRGSRNAEQAEPAPRETPGSSETDGEPTTEGSSARPNADTLDCSRLPPDVLTRLRSRLHTPSEECFVVERPTFLPMLWWPAVGGVLVAWSIWATNGYRWVQGEKFLYSLLAVGGATMVIWGVGQLIAWGSATVRPGIFLTPLYMVRTGLNDVYFRWLWGFDDFNAVHNHENGAYKNSTFTLTYGSASETFLVRGRREAEQLIEFLRTWELRVREAIGRSDYAQLTSLDDLLGVTRAHVGTAPKWFRTRRGVPFLAAALGWAFVAPALLIGLNAYHDDRLSWNAATEVRTASGYRLYLGSHPQGRWRGEAQTALAGLYEAADSRYAQALSDDHDAEAVAAFRSLLHSARITGEFEVPVQFRRENALPVDLEARLARASGFSGILMIGDAFTESRMQAREARILEQLRSAIRTVIPEDVLQLRASSNASPRMVVSYTVAASGDLYYKTSQEALPESKRPFYPGIQFGWTCDIKAPNSGEDLYRFSLDSAPAMQFSAADDVYDGMADSAFEDFRNALIKRLGLLRTPPS